jgi:hypothetical protein
MSAMVLNTAVFIRKTPPMAGNQTRCEEWGLRNPQTLGSLCPSFLSVMSCHGLGREDILIRLPNLYENSESQTHQMLIHRDQKASHYLQIKLNGFIITSLLVCWQCAVQNSNCRLQWAVGRAAAEY